MIETTVTRLLCAHPLACDTAAGIARRWLPQEFAVAEFEPSPSRERRAACKLMVQFSTTDRRCFYRRRHRREATQADDAPHTSARTTSDLH